MIEQNPPLINSLRGEFATVLAGERHVFDTTLGTIAGIEEACGGRAITEIIGAVVTGRRAADHIPLLTAALRAAGHRAAEATAARATMAESEAFILAFMGALGFKLAPRAEGGEPRDPLDGSSSGGDGAPSRSAA